jgi:hypothetical protein
VTTTFYPGLSCRMYRRRRFRLSRNLPVLSITNPQYHVNNRTTCGYSVGAVSQLILLRLSVANLLPTREDQLAEDCGYSLFYNHNWDSGPSIVLDSGVQVAHFGGTHNESIKICVLRTQWRCVEMLIIWLRCLVERYPLHSPRCLLLLLSPVFLDSQSRYCGTLLGSCAHMSSPDSIGIELGDGKQRGVYYTSFGFASCPKFSQ